MSDLLNRLGSFFMRLVSTLEQAILHLSHPARYSITHSTAADFPRSKTQLIAENALLRQQLIILHRQIKKPHFTRSDRLWLVLLASRVQNWKETLLILEPDTIPLKELDLNREDAKNAKFHDDFHRALRVFAVKMSFFQESPDTLLRWHRQGFRLFWKFKWV